MVVAPPADNVATVGNRVGKATNVDGSKVAKRVKSTTHPALSRHLERRRRRCRDADSPSNPWDSASQLPGPTPSTAPELTTHDVSSRWAIRTSSGRTVSRVWPAT